MVCVPMRHHEQRKSVFQLSFQIPFMYRHTTFTKSRRPSVIYQVRAIASHQLIIVALPNIPHLQPVYLYICQPVICHIVLQTTEYPLRICQRHRQVQQCRIPVLIILLSVSQRYTSQYRETIITFMFSFQLSVPQLPEI